MPKSASTYITKSLAQLPGFRDCWPVHKSGRIEQNLYLPSLIDLYGAKTVSQVHLRATEPNLDLIRKFDIKPVVLVRDIFDTVVSWYDHMHKDTTIGFMMYANDRFFKLDEESQYDMIIDLAMPWYFNFLVSWMEADNEGYIKPLWINYDDVTKDTKSTIRRITKYAGVECTDLDIERCVPDQDLKTADKVRFNKGVSGRGLKTLSEEQVSRIKKFASYYPGLDFSIVGIPPKKENT